MSKDVNFQFVPPEDLDLYMLNDSFDELLRATTDEELGISSESQNKESRRYEINLFDDEFNELLRGTTDEDLGIIPEDQHKESRRDRIKRRTQWGGTQERSVFINFDIISTGERYSRRLHRYVVESVISVRHNLSEYSNLLDVTESVDDAYEKCMRTLLKNAAPNDIVSGYIDGEDFPFTLYIPPQRFQNLDRESFLNVIMDITQSDKDIKLEHQIKLTLHLTKALEGGMHSKKAPKTHAENLKNKRSVITIKNTDESCGYRAIFVSKYFADNGRSNDWRHVRRNSLSKQENGAKQICQNAGVDFNEPMNREILKLIQDSLPDYQIIVVDAHLKTLIFKGPAADKSIYLSYDDNHYDAIININGFMGGDYYCKKCHKSYNNKNRHSCPDGCTFCLHPEICRNDQPQSCIKCFRTFSNSDCFERHLINGICKTKNQCKICKREYTPKANRKHLCDQYTCHHCGEDYFEFPHYCYIKPKEISEEHEENKIIVTYDIEASQDSETHMHQPMLLVANIICDNCWDAENKTKNTDECEICGHGYHAWFGFDCVDKFVDYLFGIISELAELAKIKIYCFAHNARAYDSKFLLRNLWKRDYIETEPIMSGLKILKVDIGNVRLVDTLSLFMLPLKNIPKAFGLQEAEKGYFPHYFNKPDNWNYVGPLPDQDDYGVKYMKPNDAKEFQEWYTQERNKGVVFNFKQDIMKYCTMDVKILCQSVMEYRRLFKEKTNLDPITTSFTLASVGLEVFRTLHLPHNTLGITPTSCYNYLRNHSTEADIWLDWQEKFHGPIIREAKVGIFRPDGIIKSKNLVFEFNGCKWHGCPCYYPENRDSIIKDMDKTPNELYDNTQEKIQYYNLLGYQVISIFSCEFKRQKKLNREMGKYFKQRKNYYNKLNQYGGCDLREALTGGRTNNIKFICEAAQDEEIVYADVCSLYPFVLKTKQYPLKHPKVIKENFDFTLNSYFGFVKCKIQPPNQLYLPVLPLKINKKLIFPLCRTCAEELNPNQCNHNNSDRSLISTWTTEEVKLAISRGYIMEDIYEILHYDTVSDNLFKAYINMFLKIKQEASGWPSWCKTEEDKLEYIRRYEEKEGIHLENENIMKNPGLRFIAKLMLNSLWGKLAQRPNMPQTKIIQDYKDYFDIIESEDKEIKGEYMVTDDTLLLNWIYKDHFNANPGNTSVAVASYVTSYARMELYKHMEAAEQITPGGLLYFDTDSVFFKRKLNGPQIQFGDYLGDLTNEISDFGPRARCTKFVSLGPKNYGFQVDLPDGQTKTVIKVKGIKLHSSALDIISIHKMIDMANAYINGTEEILDIPQQQIISDNHHTIYTKTREKSYKALSEKRRICDNGTLPYGFKIE